MTGCMTPGPHRPALPLGGLQVSQSVRRPVAPSWPSGFPLPAWTNARRVS